MTVIPTGIAESIAWVNAHLSVWLANPAAIGLTQDDVAELAALVGTAQQRLLAAQQARAASKGATLALHAGVDDMRGFTQAQIDRIRVHARLSPNPALVYQAADIPPPAAPSPTPAPGTPFGFGIGLDQDGVIELTFKCVNPGSNGGVTYKIERSLSGQQGPYFYLKTVGERKFSDDTIPPGTGLVSYKLTAIRSTQPGSPGYFAVRFGAGNQATIVEVDKDEAA
ncbi:MAG: hypothetical protein KIT54_06645 [Phycisphaeraceae bacterium]|nr:hypothetical protein [Phycisphaeraceae bacterium]